MILQGRPFCKCTYIDEHLDWFLPEEQHLVMSQPHRLLMQYMSHCQFAAVAQRIAHFQIFLKRLQLCVKVPLALRLEAGQLRQFQTFPLVAVLAELTLVTVVARLGQPAVSRTYAWRCILLRNIT